jgi:hypothetical protein
MVSMNGGRSVRHRGTRMPDGAGGADYFSPAAAHAEAYCEVQIWETV